MSGIQSFGHDLGSDEEEDDFNPQAEIASDNEEVNAGESPSRTEPYNKYSRTPGSPDEQNHDHDIKSPSASQNRVSRNDYSERKNSNGPDEPMNGGVDDNDDENDDDQDEEVDGEGHEEDDEDDEDDDDEEEEVRGHRRKRHKRDRRNQFLDLEADVEEDEDEADEDEDDLPGEGFVADLHPEDIDLPGGDDGDDRRHRELDRQRQVAEEEDAEKTAAALKERYGRSRATAVDSVVIPQRLLLPSIEDPTIWGVRCKQGKEREVVFALMKRLEDRANTREPLGITAAFERGGTMTGYVYVEARKQADVLAALDQLPSAYPRSAMVLVPINERPDLLRTTKSKTLEPGMYVRIKRGKYQGDLAQVNEVEPNGLEVVVRLVPRLDYGLNEDLAAPSSIHGSSSAASKRKRPGIVSSVVSSRPPQRLFNENEARKKHGKYLQQGNALDGKSFTYQNEDYVGGFLVKEMKIQHLQTENVNPTLEEVTKFTAGAEDGTENLDLTALAATLKASNVAANYLPGDMVEIYSGEQRGVCGKAISVHGDIITLTVTEGDLKGQTIEAPVRGLRKRFREGDHVKVVGGSKYQDEVGMVVRIKDDRVTILSDANNTELTIFSKDLREATDSGPIAQGSKFDLYDLVQLDQSTVACVIKVDRESLKVLDQTGSVRSLLPSNISNKLERRRFAVATDRDGTEIRAEDTVKEATGEQRKGRVLHIHRNFLFLLDRQQTENSGIFVVRHNNVVTVAAKGGRTANAGPDLGKMNPAMQRNGSNGVPAMAPPRSLGKDRILGKTVTIKRGVHKGLLGIVKDTTDTEARVELHTRNKVVNVAKDNLNIKDPITGQILDFSRFSGQRARPSTGAGGYSGATPSRVPDGWEGGRTPAFGAGNKTPAWVGGGSKTPGWKTNYGGATAYGGQSTWNANPTTPYSSSAGFSGSRTPAWQVSSQTPAHHGGTAWGVSGNASSNNPNTPYDAPTPGFSAPTPAFAARTPGGAKTPAYSGGGGSYGGAYGTPAAAPTPSGFPDTPAGGYNAATPGGYIAATPGAVGDDDPHYE